MVFHRRIHANRNRRFKSYHLRYASKKYRQYQVAVKLPGSFRLAAGNRHLHRYCIFTERVFETVAQTLHYSTRRNLPDKELRSSIPHEGLNLHPSTSLRINPEEIEGARRIVSMSRVYALRYRKVR